MIVAIVQSPLLPPPVVAFLGIAFRFVVVALHRHPSRLRYHPDSPFTLTSSSSLSKSRSTCRCLALEDDDDDGRGAAEEDGDDVNLYNL
ncbi:hypothetical protein Dimus_019118 [Dionaea muscipula]